MNLPHSFITPVPADFLCDESRKTGTATAIAFPCNQSELIAAVRAQSRNRTPLTIQGARTGITGGAVPNKSTVINLSKMNRILSSPAPDRLCVEPGLTLVSLRRYLDKTHTPTHAWFFPPDPTESSATLGGMAACNASGACSYAYGATRHHIAAATVVLADGDTLTLRRGIERADGFGFCLTTTTGRKIVGELPHLKMPKVKNAAGYWIRPDMDLIDLLIGSEGTLGILAELELRLKPRPPRVCGMICFFSNAAQSVTCVARLRHATAGAGTSAQLTAIEYFDTYALRLIRESAVHTGLLLPPLKSYWQTALYLEWALTDDYELPLEPLNTLLTACGADPQDSWLAVDKPTFEKFKAFRHAVPEEINRRIAKRKRIYPELTKLGTDFSVPDNCLDQIMQRYGNDLASTGLEHAIFGHIGNNHLHVNILPRNMSDYAIGKRLYRCWAEQVVAWHGSVSAEHGIGRLKREMLALMYGPDGIAGMHRLKHLFDPFDQLNRGALFPAS